KRPARRVSKPKQGRYARPSKHDRRPGAIQDGTTTKPRATVPFRRTTIQLPFRTDTPPHNSALVHNPISTPTHPSRYTARQRYGGELAVRAQSPGPTGCIKPVTMDQSTNTTQ